MNATIGARSFSSSSLGFSTGFGGSTTFSTFDALSGFNQQSIHPDSKPLTAFVTPFGLYEMERLSMGVRNGPASYQRGMT
jgi:hypothetical protein